MKLKGTMEVGRRYRGYGFINEFKEFCFEPEQTGSKAGQIKEVCVRDNVRVSETKNLLMIKINIPKFKDKSQYIGELMKSFNICTKILREYDI